MPDFCIEAHCNACTNAPRVGNIHAADKQAAEAAALLEVEDILYRNYRDGEDPGCSCGATNYTITATPVNAAQEV